MKRLTKPEFNFDTDFVASHLLSWSIAQALKRLQMVEDILGDEYDLDMLSALVKARDEGRQVKLPCKRGDKVWRICGPKGRKFVAERTVLSVTIYAPGQFEIFTNCSDWLGETVFLTRAEAEAALRR